MNPISIPQIPEGSDLVNAVLTTFDLDMNTLEELLKNERSPEKYLVFYGGGSFTFCEHLKDLVIDCTFPSEDPAYPVTITHAKVWLFEYQDKAGNYSYHLMIHSRNITSQNNIEIAVHLTGHPGKDEAPSSYGLIQFMEALTEHMRDDTASYEHKKERLLALTKRLENAIFSISDKWQTPDFKVVSLGTGFPLLSTMNNSIFSLCSSYDELVICAPLMDHKLIKKAQEGMHENGRLIIVTNHESIEDQKSRGLANVTFLTLKSGRYIHAKFYLRRLGDRFDLYLGSMNPTIFSVYQNLEMMVHLKNPHGITSTMGFLEDFFTCEDLVFS